MTPTEAYKQEHQKAKLQYTIDFHTKKLAEDSTEMTVLAVRMNQLEELRKISIDRLENARYELTKLLDAEAK